MPRPVEILPEERITLGVIADTHIPDKVATLHPGILPLFQQAKVQRILHAGDISTRRVIEELSQVAPVTAVRGNRDMFAGPLPMLETIEIGGARIVLMHGHGGLIRYLRDKVKFFLYGYDLNRYLSLLTQFTGPVQAVVFGHTHHPELLRYAGKLLFNPGSASSGYENGLQPTVGLLHILPGGEVLGEILPIHGYRIANRRWVQG